MPRARARATTWMERMLSPPTAKKSSSIPTSVSPSTSPNTAHSASSRAVRGARKIPDSSTGSGSALRSIFPFGSSGKRSSTTKAVGTMNSGSRPETNRRSSSTSSPAPSDPLPSPLSSPGTTYPTSCSLPEPWTARSCTSAWRTPGQPTNAASISLGSIRKPRIFICASPRPTYSSCPSAFQRTRSPVRYIRRPVGAKGSAMKRSAVRAVRLW